MVRREAEYAPRLAKKIHEEEDDTMSLLLSVHKTRHAGRVKRSTQLCMDDIVGRRI